MPVVSIAWDHNAYQSVRVEEKLKIQLRMPGMQVFWVILTKQEKRTVEL